VLAEWGALALGYPFLGYPLIAFGHLVVPDPGYRLQVSRVFSDSLPPPFVYSGPQFFSWKSDHECAAEGI